MCVCVCVCVCLCVCVTALKKMHTRTHDLLNYGSSNDSISSLMNIDELHKNVHWKREAQMLIIL